MLKKKVLKSNLNSKLFSLMFFVLMTAAAAVAGNLFTMNNIASMFQQIQKPSWAPPGWLFGPVWTVLYILIAVAGWRVWLARAAHSIRIPMIYYGLQLVLNSLWTLLYFELKMPWLAFAEIVALFIVIWMCVLFFWRISRTAALCMIPYGAWVGFAAILNLSIARMNTW